MNLQSNLNATSTGQSKTINPLQSLNSYFELMTHFGSSYIFKTAQAMGVFKCFSQGAQTSEQVASQLSMQVKPCELLLNGLMALNLFEKQGDQYVPTLTFQFVSGQYQNLGQEYWDHLPVLLKTGVPLVKMNNPSEAEVEYQRQVQSLEWMMRPAAQMAAHILGLGTKKTDLNIIDFGAGSGVWSTEFLKLDKKSQATLVDFDGVLQVAKKMSAEKSVTSQVQYMAANYHQIDIKPEHYNLALLGNVTHLESVAGLNSLFQKAYRGLKSQGQMVIFDVFPNQESGKVAAHLYALGLALRTQNGHVYTEQELFKVAQENGFKDLQYFDLTVPPYTMGMIVATK